MPTVFTIDLPANPPIAEAELKQIFSLPFDGFYNSIHTDNFNLLCEAADMDVEPDFNRFCHLVTVEWARFVMAHLCDCIYADLPRMRVALWQPKEYNYHTDEIVIGMCEPLPDLTLIKFEELGLMPALRADIADALRRRDGFIPLYAANPDDEVIFELEVYLQFAVKHLLAYRLECEPDDVLTCLLELWCDTAVLDGVYDSAFYFQ